MELSLGVGAYFFKVKEKYTPFHVDDGTPSSQQAQGATYGFHFNTLLGWRVHPLLRVAFAWEIGATGAAPIDDNMKQASVFFLAGPALRYAADERRGFTAQLRLSGGAIFPLGWALGGGLGAGYALPIGRSSAVTFGLDFKLAYAQMQSLGDHGEYDDSGWMVAPSGLVAFLL